MRPGERCVLHCLHLCSASLVVVVTVVAFAVFVVIAVVVGPGVV